jgi:hypothetical protein
MSRYGDLACGQEHSDLFLKNSAGARANAFAFRLVHRRSTTQIIA